MKIQIKEISKEEAKKLNVHLIDFNPVVCLYCGNKKGLRQRFFLSNVPLTSESINHVFRKRLIEDFGLTYYAYNEENKELITTAKCPECDGERMEWNY